MTRTMRTWLHSLLTTLLSLLGLNSCVKNMYGIPEPMYGVPMVNVHFEGQVTDKAGKPLQGMGVMVENGYLTPEQTITDAEGRFAFDDEMFNIGTQASIIALDIDSTENGLYRSDTVCVDLDITTTGAWSSTASVTDILLTMEEVEQPEAPAEP